MSSIHVVCVGVSLRCWVPPWFRLLSQVINQSHTGCSSAANHGQFNHLLISWQGFRDLNYCANYKTWSLTTARRPNATRGPIN